MRILTVLILCCSASVFAGSTGAQSGVESIDFENIWVNEQGVPRTESIIEHLNRITKGHDKTNKIRTILETEFGQGYMLTDKDLPKIKSIFSTPESGGVYFLSALKSWVAPDKTGEEKTGEGVETASQKGSLSGNVYKMKQLDGSEFLTRSEDFIFLFPYHKEFFSELTINDLELSKGQFTKDVKAEIKKCAESGDKSCESDLKLLEVGGIPTPGSKGSQIYDRILREYQEQGKFSRYNLSEVAAKSLSSEIGKRVIKVQPNAFGKFTVDGMDPGFWILHYSQRILEYLYIICIKPGEETHLDLYQPFDRRPFVQLN